MWIRDGPRPENEAGLGPEFSGLGAVFRPEIAPRSKNSACRAGDVVMPLGGQQHRHCTRCRAQDDVVNVPAFRDAEEGAGPGHRTRSRRNFDAGQADA